MKPLNLRQVPANVAAAYTALGRGLWLDFASAEEPVRLTLGPLLAPGTAPGEHVSFTCQHGPLRLSNADALLSLCGETPVVCAGPPQGWYWQWINQQLSPTLQALLSSLEPQVEPTDLGEYLDCRLSVERAGERVHGVLSTPVDTLLRMLDAAQWQAVEQPLPADWPLHYPVVMGRIRLTVNELHALRPGDVLLPTTALFDSQGQGSLRLGNRQWAVDTEHQDDHLQLRLIHEEDLHHEQ